MTVIHELDAHKANSRLSARAERAIKEIRDSQKSHAAIRSGVTVSVFNREVRAADFPESLSIESADDRIVHLVKLYRNENPGIDLAIATGDYGMELRASSGGFEAISLNPSLRLPNPQDELTKKYQQAVSELNAVKNRFPKLTLGLSHPDGQMSLPQEVTFALEYTWTPFNVEAEIERLRHEYPKQIHEQAQINKLVGISHLLPWHVSIERWRDYDSKLDEFFHDYREHLSFVNVVEDAKCRSFWFGLWLANKGSSLATDIDVLIRFPNVVRFVAKQGATDVEPLEKEVPAPKPPAKPEPFESGTFRPSPFQVTSHGSILSDYAFARRNDDWTPDATVHQDNEISVHVGKLKHGHNVCLGNFVAIFDTFEVIGPFNAEYTISTTDLAEKIEGHLPFIARAKSDTESQ